MGRKKKNWRPKSRKLLFSDFYGKPSTSPAGESEESRSSLPPAGLKEDGAASLFTSSNEEVSYSDRLKSLPSTGLSDNDGAASLYTSSNEEVSFSDRLQSLPSTELSDNGKEKKLDTPWSNLREDTLKVKRLTNVSTDRIESSIDVPGTSTFSTGNDKSVSPNSIEEKNKQPHQNFQTRRCSQDDHFRKGDRDGTSVTHTVEETVSLSLGQGDEEIPKAAAFPANKNQDGLKRKSFAIKPFRLMVNGLEKLLDHATVTELAQLTDQDPDFVLRVDDLKRPLHHLMARWEKEGRVTENNVDNLIELMEILEADEALNLVLEYQASTATEASISQGIAPSSECSPRTPQYIPYQREIQMTSSSRPKETFPGFAPNPRYTHRRGQVFIATDDHLPVLQSLGIANEGGKKLSVTNSMTLDRFHLFEDTISCKNAVMSFLNRLMSYDYRAMRLFKELEDTSETGCNVPPQSAMISNYCNESKDTVKLSCRDIVYAILMHSDPFLQQEILSKLSACQLAAPLILPDATRANASCLLWGIQKITKAWRDPTTSLVQEVSVSNFPFPVVAAVRFGNPGCSKSHILNKVLGSVQGNDEHPHFFSREQEVAPSTISIGTLEAVWYLPGTGKKGRYSLDEAVCFLNLRGDALELSSQMEFVCDYTAFTIVFVSKRDVHRMLSKLDNVIKKTQVLVVLSSSGKLVPRWEGDNYVIESVKRIGAFVLDASKISQIDLCERISNQIKRCFKERKEPQATLEAVVSCSKNKGILVDMLQGECSKAKAMAEKILHTCRGNPKEYKVKALPLQVLWQKWSQLDKDRSWKGAQGNVERDLARLHAAKNKQRQSQREIGMSKEIRMLYQELLNTSDDYKQYLVFWLQHFLNKISFACLRPLLDELKGIRDALRDTAARITFLQRQVSGSSISFQEKGSMQVSLKHLKSKETNLQKNLTEKTKVFDASSLGFEHFVREFGQIYECFHNSDNQKERYAGQMFEVKSLTRMAAAMLLNGHPLEIFDGDACHVPVKWVKGVLAAVREITGDASVYVISVIGIQSSGKSTLLNSMFGVRFAVSAGRCTRGVFMQLLPVSGYLKSEIGCEYVAVIDTEGLKAPEKAITEKKSEDNELATFALCLSDMTLINIGGQTVGEDLSNILQISAHAFIRMKEVHLSSSCYLIQQFVADVTAQYRNESSTQSILQRLDQAVITAAAEEGRDDQYRQFSDCFNIVNIGNENGNVQYIPSLWRGSMASPNHDYSETVLKLKSALLKEIKTTDRSQKLSDFEKRIVSVWNAVKQEDFVFNFRNTIEISQYNKFTQMFKKKQFHLTREMMRWELDAKLQIRNSTAENVGGRKEALLHDLEQTLAVQMEEIKVFLEETLQNREFESVQQHSTFFFRDLEHVEKNILDTVKKMIAAESDIISNAKAKEHHFIPKLRADLRKQVLPVAERLQKEFAQEYAGKSKEEISNQSEEHVKATFEEEWSKCMKDIELTNPSVTEMQIRQSIESDIVRCVKESLQNTGLSKDMKDLMSSHKLLGLCDFTPTVKSEEDVDGAFRMIARCDREITGEVNRLLDTVQKACRTEEFEVSEDFYDSVRDVLTNIASKTCEGCRDKAMLIVILSCHILQSTNDALKRNLLMKIVRSRDLLRHLKQSDICTEWKIKDQVNACLKAATRQRTSKSLLKKLSNWVITDMLGWSSDNSDENLLNKLRGNLHNITSNVKGKKWYSIEATREFVDMVNESLHKFHVNDPSKREKIQLEACGFYIQEAVLSEMNVLAERISWSEVQDCFKTDSLDIIDQTKKFIDIFEDVIPFEASAILDGMSKEDILKFSNILPTDIIRHTLDKCFIMELPPLDRENYITVFTVVAEVRHVFLAQIKSSGTYSTNLLRTMITSIHQELNNDRNLNKREKIVAIAHVCSWAFPICVDVQTAFEKKRSVQTLLEAEKEHLYEDFKKLCDGTCRDHLAAKSFCSIIEASLKECLKNRICTAMFERLSRAGNDIFCSRPRFLRAVLESLCIEEDFESYIGFLQRNTTFLQSWTLSFIANQCSDEKQNCIRIKDITMHEIGELLRETVESLEATLRALEGGEEEVSFERWITNFTQSFEDTVKSSLNDEDVSEMSMYTVLSDYSLFATECKSIVQNALHEKLLEYAELPDTSCVASVKEWFECLPKKLHILLAHAMQGCGTQCPFCKTLCDDTVKEHKVHFSNLHFPNGVGGWRGRSDKILVCDTCTANVASQRRYYSCHCPGLTCAHSPRPYKEYKNDYPDWDIKPIADYEATLYWKWVLSRFNDDFARFYNCRKARIPWGAISKEEALSSIRNDTF